jgi:hypothetical protein
MPHIIVNPGNIRPVPFDRHDVEAVPLDQAAGDLGPRGVEFVRPMGRFPEKDDTRIAKSFERIGEVRSVGARKNFRMRAKQVRELG